MLPRATMVLAALSALPALAASEVFAQALEFPDGQWMAEVTAAGVAKTRTAAGVAKFDGTMEIIAYRGNVNGAWNLTGTGEIEVPRGEGASTYVIEGHLTGTSRRPIMNSTDGRMDIVMTIEGITVDRSVDLGVGTPVALELVSVTCKQVTGRWQVGYADMMRGKGWFIAAKVDEDRGPVFTPYARELQDLLWNATEFAAATVKEKVVDVPRLESLLATAQRLARDARRNEGCGIAEAAKLEPAIAEMLADLIQLAYDYPELFDTGLLVRLTRAAVELGALGPDAANAEAAAESADLLAKMFEQRLVEAEDTGDCREAARAGAGAREVRDVGLAERAARVMEGMGC
jgi:hypothetical protein